MKRLALKRLIPLLLSALLLVSGMAARADLLQKQNDTTHGIPVYATDTNNVPLNGLTLNARIQPPGASTASVAGAGTFSQPDTTNSPGIYYYLPGAGDWAVLGNNVLNPAATAGTGYATAVIGLVRVQVVPNDPYDIATGAGQTALLTGQTSLANGQTTIISQTSPTNQQAADVAALIAQGYTVTRAGKLDNADVTISSRLPTSGYTAPPALPGDYLNPSEIAKLAFLDVLLSSRLPTSGYTAPANVSDYARNNVSPSWYTAPGSFPTDYARNNAAPTWYAAPPTDYQQRGLAVTLPAPPTGYGGSFTGLTGSDYAGIWAYSGGRTITGGTIGTYTGNTPQTGDSFPRLGAPAGATLALDIAAAAAAANAAPAATVTALKADAQWIQIVTQVSKIYAAEWGGIVKNLDGSYNVLSVGGTSVIGVVHPGYDSQGRPTNTTKVLN